MTRGLIIGALILALLGGSFYWYKSASASIGNLNLYEGTAEIGRGDEIVEGKTGSGVKINDILKTGPGSRVSLILKDGSVIRLEAGSQVEILKLIYEDEELKDASFRLIEGKMWSKVKPLTANANWEVETPKAVAAVRGTSFNTRYTDNSTGVAVYEGKVGLAILTDRENEKLLLWNNSFKLSDDTLTEDFAKEPTLLDPSKFDEWILFNLKEDAKLENKTLIIETATTTEDQMADKETDKKIDKKIEEVEKKVVTPAPKPTIPQPSARKLASLSLYGNKSNILIGEETKLKVRATYSDGMTEEVPYEKITWLQNKNLGRITSPGYYSSQKATSIEVIAAIGDIKSNSVTINVKETLKVLRKIEISYTKNSNSYGNQTYYEYPTVQFTATAYFDDKSTENVTSKASWTIASGSAGESINSSGLYTPETKGEASIEASYQDENSSVTISIP